MILYESCTSVLLIFSVLWETGVTGYRGARQDFSFDENHLRREFQVFRKWKRSNTDLKQLAGKSSWTTGTTAVGESRNEESSKSQQQTVRSNGMVDPPPIDEPALMGRYIVNQADWTSVATISSRKDIASFPYTNVISVSDGLLGNGTGIPYMYLTPFDFTAQDIALDHRATLMMTLAQGEYCKQKVMDAMDPRCPRISLTGKIKEVKPGTAELEVAKQAVFGRHPWLAHMPADHHFFFAKLEIASIVVLDAFGGPKYVTVQEYFHPPSLTDENWNVHRNRLQLKSFDYRYSNDRLTSKYVYTV